MSNSDVALPRVGRLEALQRLKHHLVETGVALAGPLGQRVMTPANVRRARFVPGPPRLLFRPFRVRRRPWVPFSREIPAELLTTPGVRRDPVEADAAFAEGPLPVWAYLHADAATFVLSRYWRSLGPILPLIARAIRRAAVVSSREVTATPTAVDPAVLTSDVKAFALGAGASAIGIAEYDPKYTYDAFQGDVVGDRVLLVVVEQEWKATQGAPSPASERSAFSGYTQVHEVSAKVVEYLKSRGYRAQVHPLDGHSVDIHYGVEAGLGQLGLNGQLLTPQAGSRCRLLSIDTDAPLEFDRPVDYGITKVCDNCRACVERCPSGAIPGTRKMHRGVEKIKINTGRCLPVVAQAEGCAVCMKVCPVQRYGLGAVLDEWERSGTVLGRGSDELEAYRWPLDGRSYGPGQRPTLRPEFFAPPGTDWDFKRQPPPGGTRAVRVI